MPTSSYLLSCGNSEEEPLALCVRATGETPEDAIERVKRAVAMSVETGNVRLEQVAEHFYRIVLCPPGRTRDFYVNAYVNLDRLRPEHVVEGDTQTDED